jgi:hypothetical protein
LKKKILLVLLLLFGLDRAIGLGLGLLQSRTRTGDTCGLINAALETDAPIVVLGSSRVRHHVMPEVLQAATGMRAYNAGVDGQDLMYALLLHERLRLRYKPKVLLLHLDPESLQERPDEYRRLGQFARWVDVDRNVAEVLERRGPFERVKLWSHAYRYNGMLLPILRNAWLPRSPDRTDGFQALPGRLASVPELPPVVSRLPSATHLADLRTLVARCREDGTRLVLFTTPSLRRPRAEYDGMLQAVRAVLADAPEVSLLAEDEWAHPERFSHHPELFNDVGHLNEEGARRLSHGLGDQLAGLLAGRSTGVALK